MKVTTENLVGFINQQIENELSDYYINSIAIDDIDLSDIENSVEEYLDNELENWRHDGRGDIIYYSNAMEFLMENDASLNRSLTIASEFGFEPHNLNSEILASLLNTQMMEEEYDELKNNVIESITDYLEENEIIEGNENEND